MTVTPRVAECPKHGEVGIWPPDNSTGINMAPHIAVALSGLEGYYCLRCYAEWLQGNINRLTPKE